MKNQFDSDNYPDGIPSELFVGSRWAWKNSQITSVYPTTAYTLLFRFTGLDSTHTDVEITASKISSEHIIEIGQSTTAGYTANEYWWRAVVVRDTDSEEVTVNEGYVTLRHDQDGGDVRSHTYKVLQAIRSTIEGTATKEQESYSVAGRSLSRRSIEELTSLRKEYEQKWESDKQKTDLENGRKTKPRVIVKMGA
jgi:hypothetical protein